MNNEIWKPIPGFGGHYEASSLGRVRVLDRTIIKRHSRSGKPTSYFYKGRVLSPKVDGKGYIKVHLGVDKEKTCMFAHHAVLLAFVGPAPEGHECCHNNGISFDNRIENLRWDTHFNNNQDRVKHGTYAIGEGHPMAKYSECDIRKIVAGELSFAEAKASLGISMTHFYRIKKGGSWSHVSAQNRGKPC